MKKLITLVLAVFVSAMIANAQTEKSQPWQPSGFASVGIQNGYIGKQVSRELYSGQMLWTEFELNLPCHMFVDFWDSTRIDNGKNTGGDEFDLTFGIQWDIGKWNVKVSTALYNVYPLNKWWDGDIATQTFALSRSFDFGAHNVKPELKIAWISMTDDFGGGAFVLMPSVTHTWNHPLNIRCLTLVNQLTLVHDTGFKPCGNSSDGLFSYLDVSLNWQLTKRIGLTLPSVELMTPLTETHDGRNSAKATVGGFLTFSF